MKGLEWLTDHEQNDTPIVSHPFCLVMPLCERSLQDVITHEHFVGVDIHEVCYGLVLVLLLFVCDT